MKKAVSGIIIIITLFFYSCDNLIETGNQPENIKKNSIDNPKGLNPIGFNYDLIPLPSKSPLYQDSVFTVSKVIDGETGGRITYDTYYIGVNGDSIIIDIDLFIPPFSFEGIKEIAITVDSTYAALHFYPQMKFFKPLFLFQSFSGLDLSEYETGTIDFWFFGDDGTIELVKKEGVQIIIPQGIVRLMNARFEHFSRYGWVRKDERSVRVPLKNR